jgi:hypothetical protein
MDDLLAAVENLVHVADLDQHVLGSLGHGASSM